MNTYAKVQSLITAWKSQSLSRTDLIRAIAEACLGWPYVWGAAGQKCTPSHRRAYAARSACPEGEAARILKKCPVCSGEVKRGKAADRGWTHYASNPQQDQTPGFQTV